MKTLTNLDDKEALIAEVRASVIGDDAALAGPFGLRRVVYADYKASGRSRAGTPSGQRPQRLLQPRQLCRAAGPICKRIGAGGVVGCETAAHSDSVAVGLSAVEAPARRLEEGLSAPAHQCHRAAPRRCRVVPSPLFTIAHRSLPFLTSLLK
jgi:hypothetical protein